MKSNLKKNLLMMSAELSWRRLALQFDEHRMQALAHLRCLLENPEAHREAAIEFLAKKPPDGEAVLAQRIKDNKI